MSKLLLCTNLDCPIMYECVRSMKPINDQDYIYADFTYHKLTGCSGFIKRQSSTILNPSNPQISTMKNKNEPTTQEVVILPDKKSKKKKSKTVKQKTRRKCLSCKRGFLANRSNQFCCSSKCSVKNALRKAKNKPNQLEIDLMDINPFNSTTKVSVKKRGRPKKVVSKAVSKAKNAPATSKNGIYVMSVVINNRAEAEKYEALCKAVFPDIIITKTVL